MASIHILRIILEETGYTKEEIEGIVPKSVEEKMMLAITDTEDLVRHAIEVKAKFANEIIGEQFFAQ